ncbi:hypothetical protein [Ottowia testudinis]|uniref:DUF4136 domain-containing protein n=1 Tax=Ottowia testudinis TaxID=2816950 RepID=A0A975CH74_9BURK|nr:hypothetical protein [Ottowia testudinis]QTD44857.1 hypothetical protein J1M35_17660 [Ottowia testudinis]
MLTACATGPRTVDAQVRTNAAQPPGDAVLQGAHYRFERAPLVAGQPDPARLEAMAQAALARVGAVRDDTRPRVSVQVGGQVSAYWLDDSYHGGLSNPRIALGVGRGWGGGGFGLGMGWPLQDPSIPAYISEVSLLMRDLQTGQIVYDTRARHDGPWHGTEHVLAALFVAALEGYPRPALPARRVGVPLLPVVPEAVPATAPPR